jgi:hypothetical protein
VEATCPSEDPMTELWPSPNDECAIEEEEAEPEAQDLPISELTPAVPSYSDNIQSRPGSSHLAAIEEVMSDAPQMPEPEENDESDATVLRNPLPSDQSITLSLDLQISPTKAPLSDLARTSPPQTPLHPHTPRFREIRTVTTTTTIPMNFDASSTPAPANQLSAPPTPVTIAHPPMSKAPTSPFPFGGAALRPDGTLDREAALEQIRLRRGRARSVAMGLGTPRKQMMEGLARRDISAPALKGRG